MNNDLLRGLVDEIAKPFWQTVYDGHVAYLERLLEDYRAEADTGDGEHFIRPYELYRNKKKRDAARTLSSYVSSGYSFSDPVTLVDDPAGITNRLSKRHADEVLGSFKAKLLRKLNGLLDGSGVEGEIRGDLGCNRIRLREKATGLAFTVYSQVVSVWPCWARPHHRYPTTFHDVSVNGKLVGRKLSEEEIKKLASELRGEKFVPTAEKKRKAVSTRRFDQRMAKAKREVEKAERALERALKRCERAATEYDKHSAKYDYDEAHGKLLRTLKRYELPLENELLVREPNFNLDDPATASERLKSIKKTIREAKKSLAQYEAGNGMGSPDPDTQQRMAESVRGQLAEYEEIRGDLEGLVKKAG